jgi:DNA-binding MarR family transcriptional regulator
MSLTPDTQEPGHDGLWVSVSDLAARKGVTKQTIAEKVSKLEAGGLLETRPGKGRTKLVNLAAYDRAIGSTGDAVREMAAATKAAMQAPAAPTVTDGSEPVLAKEQARRLAYQADLAKLDLDERLGKLLPIDDVEAAMVRCAEALTRSLDQMPTRADELAAAVAKDGVNGARAFLKVVARDMRALLAREMRLLDRDASAEVEVEEQEDT